MKVGVFDHLDNQFLPPHRFYAERLQIIEMYEAAGIHCYHIAEHHGTSLGMAPSPNVFLASVAQRTEHLRFGPMVYALPLYHPLRLAEEIAMLDQISMGRLEMGFGRGSSPVEKLFFGLGQDEADQRHQTYLSQILTALSTAVFHEPNQDAPFNEVRLAFRCFEDRMPTIWYGVHQPISAAKAAAKGWNTINLDSAEEARECADAYWDAADENDAPNVLIGLGRFIVVADSEHLALGRARRAYAKWHGSFTHLSRMLGSTARHPRPDTWEELCSQGKGFAGTPEQVVHYCAEQMDVSRSNYLVGQLAFGDLQLGELKESVSLFAEAVMPKLARMSHK
jgi:alkanesulfonate monooxygenase SsuD/methylene tetrahydromethanopterin reductase-like flavin-dependent oxidoreductase (luciferase family)